MQEINLRRIIKQSCHEDNQQQPEKTSRSSMQKNSLSDKSNETPETSKLREFSDQNVKLGFWDRVFGERNYPSRSLRGQRSESSLKSVSKSVTTKCFQNNNQNQQNTQFQSKKLKCFNQKNQSNKI